jgi:phosphonoacetate hydrolase
MRPTVLRVNARSYALPKTPTVVVCIDGCEPDYLAQAVFAGRMPWLKRVLSEGTAFVADGAMPSFTNPNNVSIVTGVPPSVHGICGNYFYDAARGVDVMMNDPEWLRAPTILAALADAGASVAAITAKDKLRRLLGDGLRGICFSAEKADQATRAENGIDGAPELVGLPLPGIYSAALSEFVLAAGVRLMETRRPDAMYLSTSDYVQHKHAPGSAEANAFYAMIDAHLNRLEALGCVIAITADHGMNAKTRLDASPDVIHLQDTLDVWLQPGAARVILPITDPYVAHHGALGSFATVHMPADANVSEMGERIAALPGVELVLPREAAAERFELPPDRIGDLVVIGERSVVLGISAAKHDLSGLDLPLRSHGGISERRVPLVLNRKIKGLDSPRRWRNFDVFDLALNHAQ